MTPRARALVALIAGQISLHACMAGLRLAAPLQALRGGGSAAVVGVLLALYAAAPIALALHAGRLADRHGYHRPLRIAVALTFGGGVCAVASTWLDGGLQVAALALTAILAGAGANFGLITIQRTAGRQAADAVDVKRIFSWLGLAPALANIVGPMIAGGLIDTAGFRVAYLALALLPLAALGWTRSIASEAPRERPADVEAGTAWDLLGIPGVRRLLLVNWLLSASWDVHAFVLPILGHERGFSASAIGSILGAFAAAVALVRIVVPWLAHRMREADVLVGAMLMTAGLLAVYPLTRSTSAMALCAVGLGVALGAVQPMIMSTLHQLTPPERQGQAIALRSMTINGASTVMPLLFGALGTAIGAGTLFWVVSAALGAGSLAARRIGGEQRAV